MDGLVPHLMHDILEDILRFELKEFLKFLISEKVITLANLNDAIHSFPYTFVDVANKPNIIEASTLCSTDHSLKQTSYTDNHCKISSYFYLLI